MSRAKDLFEEAVKLVNQSIINVKPGLEINLLLRRGYFEQVVFMLWVATRVVLYDRYLPKRRLEIVQELLQTHPALSDATKRVFTRSEVEQIISDCVEELAQKLSSLRQGTTAVRGKLFEHVLLYPLSCLLHGRQNPQGKIIEVNAKATKYHLDGQITLNGRQVLGLSIKGNIRERLAESVERAQNARLAGDFQDVWHIFLTVGDEQDRAKLVEAAHEPGYRGERIYTWTVLVQDTLNAYPSPYPSYRPLSELPEDIKDFLTS